jgi:hypothetical protein
MGFVTGSLPRIDRLNIDPVSIQDIPVSRTSTGTGSICEKKSLGIAGGRIAAKKVDFGVMRKFHRVNDVNRHVGKDPLVIWAVHSVPDLWL